MLDMYYDLMLLIKRSEISFIGTKAFVSQRPVLVSPVFQIKIGERFYCSLYNTFRYEYWSFDYNITQVRALLIVAF